MELDRIPAPRVIGTAGHIDHGKTRLVAALTGIEPDCLPEEKRRGMTIDLGFARAVIPPHGTVGFVDVPGHEAYLRNMLAGASGIDAGLLVVAADDGVMPQTREHVDLLDLLGIPAVVCALTKIDAVDADMRALAAEDVRAFLAGTPYADAPVVPVSSVTGEGLDVLLSRLSTALDGTPPRQALSGFRLPMDRVFNLRGIGCVVTGTVWSGAAAVGDEVVILPQDRTARIRQLHAYGQPVERVQAGQRAAVNLAGVKTVDVARGCVAAAPGALRAWRFLDAHLRILPSAPVGLRSFQRVRVNLATAETFAKVVFAAGVELAPGAQAVCQLRLETPLVAARGDRLVVRRESPVATLGGGTVLLPDGVRHRSRDTQFFAELASLAPDDLAGVLRFACRCAGMRPVKPADLIPALDAPLDRIRDAAADLAARGALVELSAGSFMEQHRVHEAQKQVLDAITELRARDPARTRFTPLQIAGAARRLDETVLAPILSRLVAQGKILDDRGAFVLPGSRPTLTPRQARVRDAIAAEHAAHPFSPEGPSHIAAAAGATEEEVLAQYRLMEEEGRYVRLAAGVFLGSDELAQAGNVVRELAAAPGGFAVKDLRDRLGTTRRHAVPLLEWCDAQGLTRRLADNRRVTRPGTC